MKSFKSFIYGLVITVMLCSGVIAVQETMVGPAATFSSSGLTLMGDATPTSVIISGGGIGAFGGIVMHTNGVSSATMTVYDSAAASSGTVLFKGSCLETSPTCVFALPWPIGYAKGLVVYKNSGTGSYVIYYDNRGK
jgi:hypothetical protein